MVAARRPTRSSERAGSAHGCQLDAKLSSKVVPYWRDLLVIAVGALVYVGLLHSHGLLFGVPVALGA